MWQEWVERIGGTVGRIVWRILAFAYVAGLISLIGFAVFHDPTHWYGVASYLSLLVFVFSWWLGLHVSWRLLPLLPKRVPRHLFPNIGGAFAAFVAWMLMSNYAVWLRSILPGAQEPYPQGYTYVGGLFGAAFAYVFWPTDKRDD